MTGASPHGGSRAKSPRSEHLGGPSAGCPSSMLGSLGLGLRVFVFFLRALFLPGLRGLGFRAFGRVLESKCLGLRRSSS